MNKRQSERLIDLRAKRNFTPERYFRKKIEALVSFFEKNDVDTVVFGLSGGIDSALVLYIFDAIKQMKFSPLKRIVPVIAPIHDVNGVTGQADSEVLALNLCEELGYQPFYINLKPAYDSIIDLTDEGNNPWSEGQMASVLRTPVMYYVAALEQSKLNKSIVVGTTNKSEGSYIGFFGKASDGMNDLQPISDLYKSEVIELAKGLGVPDYIINRDPMGDVFDKKTDEELMGVTYDELELYLLEKEYGLTEKPAFNYEIQIEKLHSKNSHKYQVGMPSHFLNIFGNDIPGGWSNYPNINL